MVNIAPFFDINNQNHQYFRNLKNMAAKGDQKPGRLCARSMPLNYDKHWTLVYCSMPHIELSVFYNTNIFKLYGSKLSYIRCREIFKRTLKDLGYDDREYGLHSLRAGGATEVVNHGVISERLLKIHGRWKTDAAKDICTSTKISAADLA